MVYLKMMKKISDKERKREFIFGFFICFFLKMGRKVCDSDRMCA